MKVSYHKRFDSEGCSYNQAISISRKQFDELYNKIDAERCMNFPRKGEYVHTAGYELYLYRPYTVDGVSYLNHTQTRFINLFLKLNLKDWNTCLLIRG